MPQPSLTLIGGPNGSGKSSLLDVLRDTGIPLPNYLNADDIARGMIGPADEVGHAAQALVRTTRNVAIEARQSVTYETVMSHPSHLKAMRRAVALGFYVRLIFITTDDPQINVARVADRVVKGGHDVPRDKIISRYHRIMNTALAEAVQIANEAMIFDSSQAGPGESQLVAHVRGQFVTAFPTSGLAWPDPCLFAPLRGAGYAFAP